MIVIAAAGLSRRFTEAGYKLPKFMLPLGKRTVFDEVLASYKHYAENEHFVVPIRGNDSHGVYNFVKTRMEAAGIKKISIVPMGFSDGMLPHVYQAINRVPHENEQLVIAMADIFRPNYEMPPFRPKTVTIDFAQKPEKDLPVRHTFRSAVRTSDLKSSAYHFDSVQGFLDTYGRSRTPSWVNNQLGEKAMEITEYVRTIGSLLTRGYAIRPRIIPIGGTIFCGNPAQYQQLQSNY